VLYGFPLRVAVTLLLIALLAVPLAAQAPGPGISPDPAARSQALRSLEQASLGDNARKDKAAAASAERAQHELTQHLADFANAWNKLITLAEKGVWNAKQAAKTRKAFDKLVHSEGWIEETKNIGADQ
jgi:hypothetical protein